MIGDVEMQTIKRGIGRSLTDDRPLFLALITYLTNYDAINLQQLLSRDQGA